MVIYHRHKQSRIHQKKQKEKENKKEIKIMNLLNI